MTVTSIAPLPDDAVRSVVDEPATTSPERPARLTTPMSIVWRLGQSDGDGRACRSARNAALSLLTHQRGRNSRTANRHPALPAPGAEPAYLRLPLRGWGSEAAGMDPDQA